ncbi:MAG: GNAT family N-acetyltransferase [Phocaeicola sp.]
MIRELIKKDKEELNSLVQETVEGLQDKSFLIPLTEEEQELLFSEKSSDTGYGLFEKEKLVAATGLFFELADFQQESELKGVDWSNAAELGGNMTRSHCRGKGYMHQLCQKVVESARERKLSYLLATAHPENSAGIGCLLGIGMQWVKEYDRHGYRRNIYLLPL